MIPASCLCNICYADNHGSPPRNRVCFPHRSQYVPFSRTTDASVLLSGFLTFPTPCLHQVRRAPLKMWFPLTPPWISWTRRKIPGISRSLKTLGSSGQVSRADRSKGELGPWSASVMPSFVSLQNWTPAGRYCELLRALQRDFCWLGFSTCSSARWIFSALLSS